MLRRESSIILAVALIGLSYYGSASGDDVEAAALALRSDPSGATLWLDDKDLGETALIAQRIEAGDRDLKVSSRGFVAPTVQLPLQRQGNIDRGILRLAKRGSAIAVRRLESHHHTKRKRPRRFPRSLKVESVTLVLMSKLSPFRPPTFRFGCALPPAMTMEQVLSRTTRSRFARLRKSAFMANTKPS